MTKIGFFERSINFAGHKVLLASVSFMTLAGLSTSVSPDKITQFDSSNFKVSFQSFSPAFAAFEDDYLFNDEGQSTLLRAGKEDSQYISYTKETVVPVEMETIIAVSNKSQKTFMDQFDGSISLNKIEELSKTKTLSKTVKKHANKKSEVHSEELPSGSLFAMVNNNQPNVSNSPNQSPGESGQHIHEDQKSGPITQQGSDEFETPDVDFYKVSGSILLREGLAFIGSMEVSWVVGDHELQIGSINVPDATFEIEVSKLVGDIIVSLYDSNDELIGEGLYNLNQVDAKNESIATTIEIHPIDWDMAGQIVNADSLGTEMKKPVEGADIALYAFNDATLSEKDGTFSFLNWKKTNSRTLAIASKEGFKDSIVMLDSKKSQSILLFTKKYMDSFFEYIQELGIFEVAENGTIYGQVSGVSDRSGYKVALQNSTALYFIPLGLATIDLDHTSSNGMFAFVGLQDGDYQLTVEKDGEILEEKLVVVEQGKVSPVLFNLSTTYKHIEFYDPLDPDRHLNNFEVSFFDGSTTKLSLDRDNMSRVSTTSSSDPGIIEVNTLPNSTRTLLSHNKGLQKVPFIQNSIILDLAQQKDMVVEDGLIIGLIQSEELFRVGIMESPAAKIIYFNNKGKEVDPSEEIAYGFIMSGFPKGLSSILIDGVKDNLILGSDLVFSDHESVSVIQLDLLPVH